MRNITKCKILTGRNSFTEVNVAQDVGNFPQIVEFEVTDGEGKLFRYALHGNFSSRHERLSLRKVSCSDAIGNDVCTECHNKPTYALIEHDGISHPGNIVPCSKCHKLYVKEKIEYFSPSSLEKYVPNFDLGPLKGDRLIGKNGDSNHGSD